MLMIGIPVHNHRSEGVRLFEPFFYVTMMVQSNVNEAVSKHQPSSWQAKSNHQGN
ncbi:MAG: hypothetical protein HYZ34_12470 [Ignavibacteriae bacterium]|nr:hypothetical protein [Ignavibacteriota bacterium]